MASTPTPPEDTVQSFTVTTDVQLTEMGVRFTAHSKPVNVMVELDLDWDPSCYHGVLKALPQLIEEQLERLAKQGEGEKSDPLVQPGSRGDHGPGG